MREGRPLKVGKDRRVHVNVAFEVSDAEVLQAGARGMPVTAFVRFAALHMADRVLAGDAAFVKTLGV